MQLWGWNPPLKYLCPHFKSSWYEINVIDKQHNDKFCNQARELKWVTSVLPSWNQQHVFLMSLSSELTQPGSLQQQFSVDFISDDAVRDFFILFVGIITFCFTHDAVCCDAWCRNTHVGIMWHLFIKEMFKRRFVNLSRCEESHGSTLLLQVFLQRVDSWK